MCVLSCSFNIPNVNEYSNLSITTGYGPRERLIVNSDRKTRRRRKGEKTPTDPREERDGKSLLGVSKGAGNHCRNKLEHKTPTDPREERDRKSLLGDSKEEITVETN